MSLDTTNTALWCCVVGMCCDRWCFCSGQWQVFTGNDVGALIGWWLWTCNKQAQPRCGKTSGIKHLFYKLQSK